jgi:hypothetical protein
VLILIVKDLTGLQFGRLTVIKRVNNNKPYGSKWLCKCDCGNELIVFSNNLKRGNTRSCGCLALQLRTKHTHWGDKVYKAWDNMRNRCINPNATGYEYWGGRGIKVCDEWLNDFKTFYNYVSTLEHFGEKGYSLDRIDNDGNYEVGNVRWANKTEQNLNKRYKRKVS